VPPGDKSISHRYAMLAGIAEGTSELANFALAADCHSTLACMKALGAEVKTDRSLVRVTGHGLHGLKSSKRALDAGNSGTTIRLLSGILAGQNFTSKIAGDDSLNKRPMKRILTPLREMGAQILARDENFAPLEIFGGKLRGIQYEMPMASAQVKSAVLLAGLFAEGATSVTEPARTPRSHRTGAGRIRRFRRTSWSGDAHSGRRNQIDRKKNRSARRFVFGRVFYCCRVTVSRIEFAHSRSGIESYPHRDSGCVRANGRFDANAFAA